MKRVLLVAFCLVVCSTFSFAADDKGTVVTLGKLSSRTPADWEEVKQMKPFRLKEFKVPGADKMDAELVVFESVGGGFDANLKRWKGMFNPPNGKSIDDVTKVEDLEVGKVKLKYVDIHGTYLYKPNPMAPKAEPRPDHRMLMIYFDSADGPFFIRLVGPDKTVTAQRKAFDGWIKNFK